MKCLRCGKELDFEPSYCCCSPDCGCMGLPIDPPICDECWDEEFNKTHERFMKIDF